MAENNDFTHLPLPLLFQGKPKLRGGGAVSAQTKRNTANRIAHGGYVKRRSAELSRFWKERRADRSENALPEIETGIPILIEIDPSADIDFLRGLGFEIVCEIEEGFIIETKKPEKSRQKAAGCRNTQEVIYTQPLFITPFYLLKGYRSDRLDINIPVIPKAARRDGFTR